MSTSAQSNLPSLKLQFTREFTKGIHKGQTHNDSLSFVSKARAEAWLRGIARNSKSGSINYKIIFSNINEL